MTKISQVSKAKADAIDESLGLQAISIRLPKRLIEDFKLLSRYHCIAYQALIRDALTTYSGKRMRAVRKALDDQHDARQAILERLS